MPPRLGRATAAAADLADRGVHFAPIRHHSPVCALAVAAMLDELRPAAVLIEGPEEFAPLLPVLADERTVPPVAVLSTGASGAAFFPLAAFSPEWVALRRAAEQGAETAFIDLSWHERDGGEDGGRSADEAEADRAVGRTLQSERALAHSAALAALAEREHCRDHDELWDHLFEVRPLAARRDWRTVFRDVFAWAALARLSTEPEVLILEASIAREARMHARVRAVRERLDAAGDARPVVVVTGAFHTLALVEALSGAPEGAPVRDGDRGGSRAEPAWLIRYDFTRLDALNGYGAGMPSPGYHQRMWDAALAGDEAPVLPALLVDLARAAGGPGSPDRIALPDAVDAALAAHRLAALRGHAVPARSDVLDAITSCFVRDEQPGAAFREALGALLAGGALGSVPPGTAAPPIVAEARDRAVALRFAVDDSTTRHVVLDRRRSPRARARARFLARMQFLGTGFARRTAGPDFVAGRGLGRLTEEWDVAWSPLVEAALVALAAQAPTLDGALAARLDRLERETAATRSARSGVELLAQAAVLGVDRTDRAAALVAERFDDDPELASVAGAGHRLLGLWAARAELDLGDAPAVRALLDRCVPALAFLAGGIADVAEDHEDDAVADVVSVRDLLDRLEAERVGLGLDTEPVRRELRRLRDAPASAVAGAATALAVVDGELADDDFAAEVAARLAPGADVERAVRWLGGAMTAAPDLVVHDPVLLDVLDEALRRLPAAAFLAFLPDLRRAFSALKPRETALLAERIAARTGVAAAAIADRQVTLTATDLAEGVALERALLEGLAADGTLGWVRSA